MASSSFEIANAMERLGLVLPMPRDFELDDKTNIEYQRALVKFDPDILSEAVDRILDGRIARKTNKFPMVTELAAMVRSVQDERAGADEKAQRKLYRYTPPKSKVLERNITKERASELCRNGVHPRGSIWCPGPVNDRPEYGDLFGPDPLWQNAVSIDYERQQHDDTPFEWLRKDALQRWKDFPIIEEHCTYERFHAHKGRWPIGATFVPALGQVRLNTRMPDAGKAVR